MKNIIHQILKIVLGAIVIELSFSPKLFAQQASTLTEFVEMMQDGIVDDCIASKQQINHFHYEMSGIPHGIAYVNIRKQIAFVVEQMDSLSNQSNYELHSADLTVNSTSVQEEVQALLNRNTNHQGVEKIYNIQNISDDGLPRVKANFLVLVD